MEARSPALLAGASPDRREPRRVAPGATQSIARTRETWLAESSISTRLSRYAPASVRQASTRCAIASSTAMASARSCRGCSSVTFVILKLKSRIGCDAMCAYGLTAVYLFAIGQQKPRPATLRIAVSAARGLRMTRHSRNPIDARNGFSMGQRGATARTRRLAGRQTRLTTRRPATSPRRSEEKGGGR